MVHKIMMPKLGITKTTAFIVEWKKKDRDWVEKGEALVEIETEKVTQVIESNGSGFLKIIKYKGEKVVMGDLLGLISEDLDKLDKALEIEELPIGAEPLEETSEGVTLSFETEEEPHVQIEPALEDERAVLETRPLLGIRQRIAENLVRSLQTAAQLTVFSEVDATELMAFRENLLQLREENRVTLVDLITKILGRALGEFPIINSTLEEGKITLYRDINIGVAVALDGGLVVPVVRHCDRKSLIEIGREIRLLSDRARSGELKPEDFQGGTFTITSGGQVAVDMVTPIINLPQTTILALGRLASRPAVYQERLAIRKTLYLCLTHDHRVIDGRPAGEFITRLKEMIETPQIFREVLQI